MKKAITTITLVVVLTLSATFANAGIIVAGKPAPPPCTPTNGIIVAGKAIINVLFGIIVAGKPGAEGCVETGIIVAD